MATAYAAFTSLMHLLSDLREHSCPPVKLDEEHLDSLNSKISFFQKFLEAHHASIVLELELRIADAAYAAEDVIETRIADRTLDQVDFNASLQKAIEAMNLIKKEVMTMNWNTEKKSQGSNRSIRRLAANSGENIVVGIEDLTLKIVEKLARSKQGSGRQILSITGMGGIGKTTLANNVYNHPFVGNYFDVRAWATISKDYNIHESLVELLHCLDRKQSKEILREEGEYELGDKLYKDLFGKRYLIIVDDVWDVEAWERLRPFFPDSRGSGIVITTRESKFESISSHVFPVDLLDKEKTWELFCKTVFGQDDCPGKLEGVGKEISHKCRGLPLSVVVIGGHLGKSPRTRDHWESIAKNLSSTVNSEDDDLCLKILSLSYVHLPVHLKPCFLYMGIFPEDEDIEVDNLILLWVAEGFLKPLYGRSLEEAAKEYMNDLVGRNLILVSSSSPRGEIIGCKIHDLLRDLCLKEAAEKKFFCILRRQNVEVANSERRIVLYPSSYEVDRGYSDANVTKLPSGIRTLIFYDTSLHSLVYKSLRVLASATRSWESTLGNVVEVTRQLVNLRYLDFALSDWDEPAFPSSIFSFWTLQFLEIEGSQGSEAPEEIWKMSQLRHIRMMDEFSIPNPPIESRGDHHILKNLQLAETILNFSFSEDLVERIPNVRTMGVAYDDGVEGFSEEGKLYALNNIARLEKLDVFACWLQRVRSVTERNEMLSCLTLPHSLRELVFGGLPLDDEATMTKIGSLPLLEDLTLLYCGGREWELIEGQFVRLKCLRLFVCSELECFRADSSHFPCLEELQLSSMDSLEEISSDIGDIQMLRSIELLQCPDSAVVSAKEMADYQKNEMGNEELRIKVTLRPLSSLSAESLRASNFHVEGDEC